MTKKEEERFIAWHEALHANVQLRAENARLKQDRSRLLEEIAKLHTDTCQDVTSNNTEEK